jgi:Flp pilus assembly pilin Flp
LLSGQLLAGQQSWKDTEFAKMPPHSASKPTLGARHAERTVMLNLETLVKASIRRFARDESGAVTVDWVVLTAALVGIVMTLFTFLTDEIYQNAGLRIAEDVTDAASR